MSLLNALFALAAMLLISACGSAPVECPSGYADDGRGACVQSNGINGANKCFYESCP